MKAWSIAVVVVLSLGCNKEEERAAANAKAAADRAAIEQSVRANLEAEAEAKERAEAEAKQRKKDDIVEHPGNYLETSGLTYYDEGIVNDYRQLVKVTVENKSPYKLTDLSGKVNWEKDDGTFVGSSPIKLTGAIPSGESVTFTKEGNTLSSGTIQGAAQKAQIEFTKARLIDIAD